MAWKTLWKYMYCIIFAAAYQGLMRDCTATNITAKTVPAAVSPQINAGKSCPVNCLRGTCTFLDDGSIECTDGCNDGYMGKMCQVLCMNKCSKCDRKNDGVCIKCDHGYFGKQCHKCPKACGGQGCLSDGSCKKDCLAIHVCGNQCLPGY
ncbi:tenascin-like [Haliotis rubra]|uniref:tenascin-like n=1 Tax=Haliotis rubra TaxID=36100 RepID=UPI001EE60398|nr:tenascin-like [Haliotis rubra]